MHVLITGGAGFIGANFVHQTLVRHPDATVTVLERAAGRHHQLVVAAAVVADLDVQARCMGGARAAALAPGEPVDGTRVAHALFAAAVTVVVHLLAGRRTLVSIAAGTLAYVLLVNLA